MYIKNKYISLTYKIIAICFAILGQILTLDLPNGNFKPSQFLFYTNQSNILCLLYFIGAAFFVYKSIKEDGKYGEATYAIKTKGAVVMAITVTMLIYWFMLDGELTSMDIENSDVITNLWPITNYVVHLIVPLLTIFDWMLFDAKGKFEALDPIRWLYIPLFYYIFALIVAQTGYRFYDNSRYAYFFIDPDIVGYTGVIQYVIILIIGFLLLGYLIFVLDKLFAKLKQ